MGLSCPTTAVTDLWHIRCPQRPHQHGGPTEGTSCNSHHQKRYFIRVSNDPCSHMVSSHSRVARGCLRTWGCREGLALQVVTLSPCLRALHTPSLQVRLEPQSCTPFPLPAAVSINAILHRLRARFSCWLWGWLYHGHLRSSLSFRHGGVGKAPPAPLFHAGALILCLHASTGNRQILTESP